MKRIAQGALAISMASAAVALAAPATSAAQDRAVVERLAEYGRMPQQTARRTVRDIDRRLAANAARGGERYDRVRQVVGRLMFDGPGSSRQEYERRLSQVLSRLRSGLDVEMLQALFPREENSAVMCANQFGVTMNECDALVSAATGTRAGLPYAAPDDGRAVQRDMRSGGMSRREARAAVAKVREVMLGVPRILSRDERGRAILELLEACPGVGRSREAQVRAWHVGPTTGLVRCIAQHLDDDGADPVERAELVFDMRTRVARALVEWGEPQASGGGEPEPEENGSRAAPPGPPPGSGGSARPPGGGTSRPSPGAPSPADRWREQARSHFRARRYTQAASAYAEATRADPTHAGSFAGLGAARLAAGDAAGAVEAYRNAVGLDGDNVVFWTRLARAQTRAGDRDGAIQSLQRAVSIDPSHQPAQRGLAALQSQARQEGPRLPETPSRQQIIQVMRPLEAGVRGCHPEYSGRVTFRMSVTGETGQIADAVLDSAAGDLEGTPEAECMLGVVRGAEFPRFSREQLDIAYPYAL